MVAIPHGFMVNICCLSCIRHKTELGVIFYSRSVKVLFSGREDIDDLCKVANNLMPTKAQRLGTQVGKGGGILNE